MNGKGRTRIEHLKVGTEIFLNHSEILEKSMMKSCI